MPPTPTPRDSISRLPEHFRDWLGDRRIEEVECIVADVAGISRGKAMPFAKFAREDRMYLPTSIFHQTISGEYVDMHEVNQWTESDMVLKPDYDTATAAPWAHDITLQVIHAVEDSGRQPGRGVAAQRAQAGIGPLRGRGLGAGGGARDGVLPHQAEPQPQRADRAAAGPHRAADGLAAGLFDERGGRLRQGDRRHLRLRRGPGVRARHHHPGRRRRAGRDQLHARRPGEACRPGVLLQAHHPRGGAAQQLLRDLHGQADAGRARLGDAHPPFGG